MDVNKLNDWLQVIGLFGLIASLIFIGLEMRQTQKIALSAVYQARSDSSMALRMAPFESDTLLSARTKTRLGKVDGLTAEEITALDSYLTGKLTYIENVHYQYVNGFLSEEHWQTNVAELKGMLRFSERWRRRLTDSCDVIRESLCAEIRRLAAELGDELRYAAPGRLPPLDFRTCRLYEQSKTGIERWLTQIFFTPLRRLVQLTPAFLRLWRS